MGSLFVSVVICTYRRPASLGALLSCLGRQTHQAFEVVVVEGREAGLGFGLGGSVEALGRWDEVFFSMRHFTMPKGLTRQRNAGLRAALGDVVCFLDDDVTFEAGFLGQVNDLLGRGPMSGVGGLCGYDVLNFPLEVTPRWKLRRWLGTIPSLEPGHVDHLGRGTPLGFARPFQGCRRVGFLTGFCQIYRREALGTERFDEKLPTYGGEDRDFSMRIGERWPLVMCGDLHLKHHVSPVNRLTHRERVRQSAFGMGRSFAKRRRSASDFRTIGRYALGELLVDSLGTLQGRKGNPFGIAAARLAGLLSGWRSYSAEDRFGGRRADGNGAGGGDVFGKGEASGAEVREKVEEDVGK